MTDISGHLTASQEAWERGYSILVHLANQILRAHKIREVVETPTRAMPAGYPQALRDEYVTFLKHLRPLEPYLDGGLMEDAVIWRLGDIDVTPTLAKLTRGSRNAETWMPKLVTLAGSRPMWKRKDWLSRFAGGMRENASEWRARFVRGCAEEWLPADGPTQWAKKLHMSLSTLKRHRANGTIRVVVVTSRAWRIQCADAAKFGYVVQLSHHI